VNDSPRPQSGAFAVHGIFWRRFVDWAVLRLPAFFQAPLIWVGTAVFFFAAGSARRAVARNLRLIRPKSSRLLHPFRILRVFANFGWSLADSASYRLHHVEFDYDLEGETILESLATAKNGIVLTAHMGNYDLGAALFAEKFRRPIRMVRAPEPDSLSARHVDRALEQSTAGAVRIGYSTNGSALAFDLLHAIRAGEIISVQGDRVVGSVGRAPVRFCGHKICLPNGPFVLGLVAEAPIYPLFIVRTGYRRYKIVAREPILVPRNEATREEAIATAMQQWSATLEEVVRRYWPQWFAFTPMDPLRERPARGD
jgi:lauroyl/myristoyl acyltransferase